MKAFVLSIFLFTLNTVVAKSQVIIEPAKPIDYRPSIIKLLGKHTNSKLLLEIPREHVYIFTVSLSFNAAGKVDTVYFSDPLSENLKRLINTNENLTETANKIDFKKEFAGKLIIFPIVLQRREDWKIDNINEFRMGIQTLWPKLKEKDKLKPVVLLEPMFNHYTIPIR